MSQRRCAVCSGALGPFDTAVVLNKYTVDFHRCPDCGLICLPAPTWLDEAYSNTVYAGDTGLLRRSRVVSVVAAALIRSEGLRHGSFLDWAGGYGALTRMMCDKGFDFRTYDPYVDNLLAQGLDGDLEAGYDLITAVEVLEHLSDPVLELAGLARATDRILCTTQLQPRTPPRPDEWWYYQLESGQHVSLYTERALRALAERLGYQLTSNGDQYHLFHRGPLRPATRALLSPGLAGTKRALARVVRRSSS